LRATHVLVAPDALYPFDRQLLSRLDSNGQVRWTFPVDDSTNVIRSSSGVLFVAGIAYIRAISPEGQPLWRMQLPEFRDHELVLSPAEKTLYIATNRHLYAIDSQRGHVSWATENSCTASFLCPPQPMADGSLAIKSRHTNTSKSRLRIFDATGKEMFASEPGEDFDYLVPTASNIVITSRNYVLEAVDRRNKILWTKGDSWQLLSPSLSRSRRPASFYACDRAS
jgi:outer membrane protein assembly factor BamB